MAYEDNVTSDSGNGAADDLSISPEDESVSSGGVIVDAAGGNHNEMNEKTISNAIDNANAGDTVIINGDYYEHCHLVVNKKLTIMGNGTVLSPCSSEDISNHQGIFYISPKASGTIIEGFTFVDNLGLSDNGAYGILVSGASDITVRNCNILTGNFGDAIRLESANNCLIENVTVSDSVNGIKIFDSEGIVVTDSIIKNSNFGVNIIDSNKINIISNLITENVISGIAFSGNSSNLTVIYSNITYNGEGINSTSNNNVYILGSSISFNYRNGVYIDYNITKLEIKGNFFNQNGQYEVFDDFHVKNLDMASGPKRQLITNNYMVGTDNDYDRPVWRQIYEYKGDFGDYIYDEENDRFIYVGSGGDYYGHQYRIYLGYLFSVNEVIECPNIYYKYYSKGGKPWAKDGDFNLYLSEISQIKKGVYSISIVDCEGNIATDLCSVPITFYLNKDKVTDAPEEGDIYKTVMMVNGTATVRFFSDEFNETGNSIMACAPGYAHSVYLKEIPYKTLNIEDTDIPGNLSETKIVVSNLDTYPNSNQEFIATLTDLNGTPIANEQLIFKVNSKSFAASTDSNGQAKIMIFESEEGIYTLTVEFIGDDIEYSSSSTNAAISVKRVSTKIMSSDLNMIPKMAEYYSIILKDAFGNVLANQKVTFKGNGKTYTKTTDSKGIVKVKLKFSKNKKTYKITINFAGNDKYKSFSKTNKIVVKYSSKPAKLTVPKVTIPPKVTKYYKISLKDSNGKGIAKQKVIIKLNGKKIIKKTNAKGLIKIKVKFDKSKTYKVQAIYKGSTIYKKTSKSGKITVRKN